MYREPISILPYIKTASITWVNVRYSLSLCEPYIPAHVCACVTAQFVSQWFVYGVLPYDTLICKLYSTHQDMKHSPREQRSPQRQTARPKQAAVSQRGADDLKFTLGNLQNGIVHPPDLKSGRRAEIGYLADGRGLWEATRLVTAVSSVFESPGADRLNASRLAGRTDSPAG